MVYWSILEEYETIVFTKIVAYLFKDYYRLKNEVENLDFLVISGLLKYDKSTI